MSDTGRYLSLREDFLVQLVHLHIDWPLQRYRRLIPVGQMSLVRAFDTANVIQGYLSGNAFHFDLNNIPDIKELRKSFVGGTAYQYLPPNCEGFHPAGEIHLRTHCA